MSLPQIISPQNISDGVVTLRRLDVNDVSSEYVSWLNSEGAPRSEVSHFQIAKFYICDTNINKKS